METPRTIGRYEIKRWVASGAMGEIYEARDPVIGRSVAIKILCHELSDRGEAVAWRERFRREARAAGQRQHPNIVTIFDYGEEHGNPFFVMEYVEGESLASRMKRSGPLPQEEAIAIIMQVLSAIGFAHDNGVIHRDIKPSNILLANTGAAKVADFGIARTADSDLTIAGDILGTLSYMAPEQLSGAVIDYRVDLFATAAVLFELLTGARPFQRRGVFETLVKMETEGPEDIRALNPEITPALKEVIDKALAFDPDRRYADAAEFSRAIGEACGTSRSIAAASIPADQTIVVSRLRTIPPGLAEQPSSRGGGDPASHAGTALGATGDAGFPLSEQAGSGTGRGARRRRWVVAAGAGLLMMAGGVTAATFLAPSLLSPQASKPPPEAAAARTATPVADQQPTRPVATPVAAPPPKQNPPMQAREAFDPDKVPYVKNRENLSRYQADANAKALAISTSGISGWMPTQRQALEICEFYARQPCMLYAIGKWVVPAPEPRPALGPGVGRFDPAEVPFVPDTARQLLSVYESTANTKALAVSSRGNYGLAGDAATTEEAQRLALERCQNTENSSTFASNRQRCYVYAVGDTVVFAKRATAPITAQR